MPTTAAVSLRHHTATSSAIGVESLLRYCPSWSATAWKPFLDPPTSTPTTMEPGSR
jgi:hypothetical protein